jgi:hypothetical protein
MPLSPQSSDEKFQTMYKVYTYSFKFLYLSFYIINKNMKRILISLIAVTALVTLFSLSSIKDSPAIGKAGCEAYIYISNNSLFEINLSIDGVGIGNLLVGKSKTFKVELLNDTPKKIKVKVEYQDPDYIDPKSFYLLTKTKIECGQSDSMYVAFTK